MSDRLTLQLYSDASLQTLYLPPLSSDHPRPVSHSLSFEIADAELEFRRLQSSDEPILRWVATHLDFLLEHRAHQVAEDIIEEQQLCTPAK